MSEGSLFEGTITKWFKKEGDLIVENESLFEIQTDKVTVEIPAPKSGVLRKIHFPVGSIVPLGAIIAEIE